MPHDADDYKARKKQRTKADLIGAYEAWLTSPDDKTIDALFTVIRRYAAGKLGRVQMQFGDVTHEVLDDWVQDLSLSVLGMLRDGVRMPSGEFYTYLASVVFKKRQRATGDALEAMETNVPLTFETETEDGEQVQEDNPAMYRGTVDVDLSGMSARTQAILDLLEFGDDDIYEDHLRASFSKTFQVVFPRGESCGRSYSKMLSAAGLNSQDVTIWKKVADGMPSADVGAMLDPPVEGRTVRRRIGEIQSLLRASGFSIPDDERRMARKDREDAYKARYHAVRSRLMVDNRFAECADTSQKVAESESLADLKFSLSLMQQEKLAEVLRLNAEGERVRRGVIQLDGQKHRPVFEMNRAVARSSLAIFQAISAGQSDDEVQRASGISRATFYRHKPELKTQLKGAGTL